MCDILMLIIGILTLVRGKLPVTRSREVRGPMAYVIGLIFVAPFPIAFAVGAAIAAANPGQGPEELTKQAQPIVFGIVAGALLLGVILAFVSAKRKVEDRPRRLPDYDDYEDEPRARRKDGSDDGGDIPRPRSADAGDYEDDRPRRPRDDLDDRAR